MTIYYRLVEDFRDLLEGSCITESEYKGVYFLNRVLFEPIVEDEIDGMFKYDHEEYCKKVGVLFMIFYTEKELNLFLNKIGE